MTTSRFRGFKGQFRRILALLFAFALLATACGGGDSDEAATSSDDANFQRVSDGIDDGGDADSGDDGDSGEAMADDDAMEDEADGDRDAAIVETSDDEDSAGAGGDSGASDTPSGLTPADLGRSIVYVGTVEVTVEDVAVSASMAKTAIFGLGGLLFGEETNTGDVDRTTLQFKVLPEDFQEALSRLEGLGELESQSITADDVTDRVVDLSSRITTAEVSVDRLRELLTNTVELEDIALLEAQLLDRETNLETLRGQLRTLEDQVSLATIFLTLREPAPPEIRAIGEYEVSFYDGTDEGSRCPGSDELEVDEAEMVTVCVAVTNVGNISMHEIEIRDHGLDLRDRDFTFIGADADLVLAPDETVLAWAVLEAPSRGTSSVGISALAIDDSGQRVRVGVDFERIEDDNLRIIEDDSLPGFTDALSGSWDLLVRLGQIAILIAGALLPFIWVPLIGVAGWRWDKRRRTTNPQPALPGPPS